METVSVKYDRAGIVTGYTDKVLCIDLGLREIKISGVPRATRDMFIGGRGYCLKYVFDGTSAATRYDSPENVLAIAGGPFCGETGFVGTGKFIVGTISPLTGTFCDSNVGGHFFSLVKLAGFDAIVITGKSDEDLLIFIDADAREISIREAPHAERSLLGAEGYIEAWRGEGDPSNVAFLTAGKGAKNTFHGCINSIYFDKRRNRCRSKQAGRGGTGTVMRDKGLWGVAVKCNDSKANSNHPAERERLREAGSKLRDIVRDVDPNAMRLFAQGTTSLLDLMNNFELLPVNNYQYGSDPREKDISGFIFEEKIFKQGSPDGCFPGCNLQCTKGCENVALRTGPFKGKTVAVDGPEYESAAAVTNLGVFDIHYILEYSWYCDEYGVDTISTGVLMAFLFESYERGYITSEDTEGLELVWGDAEVAMELMHRMADGKAVFAHEAGRGVRHMKEWISRIAAGRKGLTAEELYKELSLFGMECKGLEFSMYITKESLAQQGGYGFALKGPQHDEAWLIAIDQLNKELPTFEAKAEALKWFPLFRTWFNIAGLCKLPWIDVRNPEAKNTPFPAKNLPTVDLYVELVNSTLGTEKTLDDLLAESERCYTLHKLINLRQGFGLRDQDRIPMRAMAPVFMNEYESRREYYEEYLKVTAGLDIEGKTDGERLAMLHEYRIKQYEKLADVVYSIKGYDSNGIPLDDTLVRLGMNKTEYLEILADARVRVKKGGA